MSKRIGTKTPAADGILVTTVDYEYGSLTAKEPPEVGSRVTLWSDDFTPIPVIAYLDDNTPVGVLPKELGILIGEDFLWRGRELTCHVAASGISEDGEVWVQLKIDGDLAINPSKHDSYRVLRAVLGGDRHE